MTEQELADLLGRAGIRPAWQGTREARPGYQQQQSPAGALADPRTVPYRRVPTRRDREFSRAALADTMQRGAFAEPRNQFAEAGMNALETTGAPEIARGVRSIQANEPGQAAGHFALGGLGLLGTASLPFGGGARGAPPRVPRIQQAIPEAPQFGSTPFYRGAVHDVDIEQGPNRAAFFTPSREFASEFPRDIPAAERRVSEYRLREDQIADFRNPQTQQRVLAELAGNPSATEHLQRRIAQMRDKPTGHVDWVISADPAIRDAIERAGYAGVWLDEGQAQASVAMLRNDSIQSVASPAPYRLPNAPPRLPTRATDGTILPLRPPEPMRQSLVGGSDDLADAARMRPDGDQLTQMIARRDALAAEQRQLEESLAPTPASDRRAEMLNAQVRELETEIERLGGSARTQDMGRARSATYEPSDGVEMGIAPSGAVEFTYNGRATPGGGSAADAQRVFRGVYRALQEDISAFGRETYRWRPETPRQADLYRAAMARRAPEGYRFSENADGTMQLDRARPPPMFPGGRNR